VINNVAYDYENIKIDLGGTEALGARSVSYEWGFESEKQYGAGREALDATEGVFNVEDSTLTLTLPEFENLKERLGAGYMTKAARFDVSVSYSHAGEPIITDTLERCRIIKVSRDHQQGAEALEVELTLQVMSLKTNGLNPASAA
jgi:hypothetical protein